MLPHDGIPFAFDALDDSTGVALRVDWRLRFTWESLFALYAEWGDGFEVRLGEALNGKTGSLRDLAAVVSAAGGPARDEVWALSPPVDGVRTQLNIAWAWHRQGYEAARRFAEAVEADRKAAAEADKTAGKKRIQWSRFLSILPSNTRYRTG